MKSYTQFKNSLVESTGGQYKLHFEHDGGNITHVHRRFGSIDQVNSHLEKLNKTDRWPEGGDAVATHLKTGKRHESDENGQIHESTNLNESTSPLTIAHHHLKLATSTKPHSKEFNDHMSSYHAHMWAHNVNKGNLVAIYHDALSNAFGRKGSNPQDHK